MAWVRYSPINYVTSLPSSPVDGQEIFYAADATNGVIWHLRYRSGSSSSYKWEFIGGAMLKATDVATSQATTSSTYTDLTTAGPSVTAPLAGDYDVFAEALLGSTAATNFTLTVALKIGSAATSDNDIIFKLALYANNQTWILPSRGTIRRTVAANDVLKLQYKTNNSASGSFENRRLSVIPVRVG